MLASTDVTLGWSNNKYKKVITMQVRIAIAFVKSTQGEVSEEVDNILLLYPTVCLKINLYNHLKLVL